MPQTREHLAIIDLLGINHGVVALTKSDLVEPDFLDLARAEVEEAIAATTLGGAAIVACSAVTRDGLDELTNALAAALDETPARRDIGRPRLPIDRVFTMSGFGTVVTGTLIDGTLLVGDEVEVTPGNLRARIRGIESHGRKVQVAPPGKRTAVNLAGLSVDELRRGLVLTAPGSLNSVQVIDVQLRAAGYIDRPLRHNLTVTFHTGSAEVEGRLLLLDCDELPPSGTAWAQVRLAEPVAAVKGDRFIIRDSNDTLGGGRIVDTHVRRHRRFHQPTLATLEALAQGSPTELVAIALARLEPVDLRDLLKDGALDAATARSAVEALVTSGEASSLDAGVLSDGAILVSRQGFTALSARLKDALAAFHRQSPLRPGMPREELRSRLALSPRAFDLAIARWTVLGEANDAFGAISLPDHKPKLSTDQTVSTQAFVGALRANPFAPTVDTPIEEDLLAYLEARGEIVRVGDSIAFAADAYSEMVQRVTSHLKEQKTVTLAQVRDMFGTSRKYAQALLEHLDEKKITRRVGDERVLR